MADQQNNFTITTDASGAKLQLQGSGVHIRSVSDQKELPLGSIDLKQCPCTIAVDPPPPLRLHSPFDWWVLFALSVPLIFATILGAGLLAIMLWEPINRERTVDKLAQLLSEGDTKMSLSRVQALLFTYVIVFGSLMIIARTGNFPSDIPTNLAILSGGSLATYLISKGLQK